MAASDTQQEPTMEEILASIRRIISEDGDEQEDAQPEETSAEDDVADIMEAEEEAPEPEPEPDPEPEPESEMEEEMEPEPEPESEPEPEPEPEPELEPVIEDAPVEDDVLDLTDVVEDQPSMEEQAEAILSKQTADLAAEPFSQLSGLMVRNYPGSENTLDGLVREMLRPMLKEWLDQNLPTLVERMVAKEISRLTNRD